MPEEDVNSFSKKAGAAGEFQIDDLEISKTVGTGQSVLPSSYSDTHKIATTCGVV